MATESGTASGNGQAPAASEPAGGNGQAPTPAQANNGTTGNPASSSASNGQAPTTTTQDDTAPALTAAEAKRLQQELAEARREAARSRDELKKRDDATLTAQQKLERDYADTQAAKLELETELQRLHLENAGLRLGASLGITDIPAALALLQFEHATDIQVGSDGKPTNLDTLLKQVLKDHPALASGGGNGATAAQQRPPSGGGASNPGRQAGNGGLTLEIIRAMPIRERMARMAEIKAWEKAQSNQ